MGTRERLALTSNIKKHKYSINGHKRTPGSNEQSGIQVFNKWQQENAWLKRAIWNT